MTAFDQAFAIVVGIEGGLSMRADDSGSWTGAEVGVGELRGTKYGISAAAYPGRDIASLTLADAEAIYRADYWAACSCDSLPPAVALLVFDAAVHNGPDRSRRWLQQAVGAFVDSRIGPRTLAAVAATVATPAGAQGLLVELLALRTMYDVTRPSWPANAHGFARRLFGLPFSAMTMTAL